MTDLAALSEPFDKRFIETVRKGNRSESYVNHAVVTGRLNDVLGVDGWSFKIVEVSRYDGPDGAPHIAYVVGEIATAETRQWAIRQEIGVPSNVVVAERRQGDRTIHPTTVQDEIKTAVSDALKRCAMRFGVAIQLWHEQESRSGGSGKGPSERDNTVGEAVAGEAAATPTTSSPAAATEGVPAAGAHLHEWKASPKSQMAAKGWVVCDCGEAKKA